MCDAARRSWRARCRTRRMGGRTHRLAHGVAEHCQPPASLRYLCDEIQAARVLTCSPSRQTIRRPSHATSPSTFSFCDVQVLLCFLFAVRKLFAPLPKCDLELYLSFIGGRGSGRPGGNTFGNILEILWSFFGVFLELDVFCPPSIAAADAAPKCSPLPVGPCRWVGVDL